MWLPEPRSSPAPHFDGQRWLSGGRFHCARAMAGAESSTAATAMCLMRFSLVEDFVQAFVVQRARHPGEFVAEFALMGRHGVRVEGLARAPYLEDGEVVGAVGLLHDLEANVAPRGAVRITERLQRADRVVLLRRDHVDVGHAVDGAGCCLHRTDRERVVEAEGAR